MVSKLRTISFLNSKRKSNLVPIHYSIRKKDMAYANAKAGAVSKYFHCVFGKSQVMHMSSRSMKAPIKQKSLALKAGLRQG